MQEQGKKVNKKIIAMILIFTLTFGHFAFVGRWSYAAGLDFFKSNNSTDCELNAYFANATGDNKLNIKQDVNENAYMCLDIGIKGDGYIKDGMLEIAGKNGLSKFSYTAEGVFEEFKPENVQKQNTVNQNTINTNAVNENSNTVSNNVVANQTTNNVVVNETTNNVVTNETTNNVVNESSNTVDETENNIIINEASNNEVINNIENDKANSVVTTTTLNSMPNIILNENTINNQTNADANSASNKKAFENNKLKLEQINGSTKMYLTFKYNVTEYAYSSEGDTLKFTGTYVDKDLREHYVEKTVDFNITWTSKQNIEVASELTKYIPYNIGDKSGVIIQERIVVNKVSEQNAILIPTKNTTIKTNIPTIKGVMPSTVDVAPVSILGTTGKTVSEARDADFTWAYKADTQSLVIETTNDLTKDKAWAGAGYDEYIVIYQYDMNIESIPETDRFIENKINVENFLCNGESTTKELSNKAYLTGKVGEIVSINSTSVTGTTSKGKMLANYNIENPYETEIKSKVEINIASNELVNQIALRNTESNYVLSSGEAIPTQSMYYREIMITKDNLVSLVGENGYIELLSEDGQSLCKLTSNIEPNERGEYVVRFDEEIRNIWIQTTQITGAGILGLNITKGMKAIEYEKSVMKDITEVNEKIEVYAKYLDKENIEKIDEEIISTKLENTKTEATIELSTKDITTTSKVENVEMRIELNNNKETSDMYENGTFLIVFPQEIKLVEVNNVGILYGDEFQFKAADQIDLNGQTAIKLEVEGKQRGFNTVNLANGTNIVLNLNLKADIYTPNTESRIQLYYMNDDVTKYASQTEMNGGIVGYDEEQLNIVSGSGLVNITTLSGYEEGKEEIAIRGEKKVAEIDAYEEAKVAEMKVTLINNEATSVKDVKILGRIPFENNKNIITNEDLGSTFTANMINGITLDGVQNANAKVYYSENEEATEELNNSANGWRTDVEDFSRIKSYLIELNDNNIDARSVVDFKYNLNIPSNLEYDKKAFSAYKLFYSLNDNTVEEGYVSMALGTPEGPDFEIEMMANPGEQAYIGDLVTYTIEVRNTGETTLNNINISSNVPEGTVYTEIDVENINFIYDEEKRIVEFHLDTLESGRIATFNYNVTLNGNASEIDSIETYASITTNEFPNGLNTNIVKIRCKNREITINSLLPYVSTAKFTKNEQIKYDIAVTNVSNEDLNNVVITSKIPEEIIYNEAIVAISSEEGEHLSENYNITYDQGNNDLKIKIDKLKANEDIIVEVEGKIKGNVQGDKIILKNSVVAEGTEVYNANDLIIPFASAILNVEQLSNIDTTYVDSGDIIEYYSVIENTGEYMTNFINVSELIPDELEIMEANYYISNNGNEEITEEDVMIVRDNLCTQDFIITEKSKVLIKIVTKVKEDLRNNEEIEINVHTIIEDEEDENYKLESNKVKHIIRAKNIVTPEPSEPIEDERTPIPTVENTPTEEPIYSPTVEPTDEPNNTEVPTQKPAVTVNPENPDDKNIPTPTNPVNIEQKKSYKIIGNVWLDENKDGIKDSAELNLSNINVFLVDANTNDYLNALKTTTLSDGNYSLDDVKPGKYIVVFEYDPNIYSVTKYKVAGVAENKNSNAVTNKISISGAEKIVAISDVLEVVNESIGDINLGLIKNSVLDFKIEKTVRKITVNTNKRTETFNYNNVSLAKAEIHSKEMDGAKVTIEYEIKVTNTGDVPGNVSEIIDYIPEGTELVQENGWTKNGNKIINSNLKDEMILANESRILQVKLTKEMNLENTGVVENKAEIGKINAVSTNETIVTNEMENTKANVIITVKTGIQPMYMILISIFVLSLLFIIIKIYRKKIS